MKSPDYFIHKNHPPFLRKISIALLYTLSIHFGVNDKTLFMIIEADAEVEPAMLYFWHLVTFKLRLPA